MKNILITTHAPHLDITKDKVGRRANSTPKSPSLQGGGDLFALVAQPIVNKGCSSCGKPIPASATPPPQLPSNWQMFKNLVGAAADAVKSGFDVRGPEETEAALRICAECPRLMRDERGLRCGACGCFLNLKVQMTAWHCPLGKW